MGFMILLIKRVFACNTVYSCHFLEVFMCTMYTYSLEVGCGP